MTVAKPTADQLAELDRFKSDAQFYDANREDLLARYPGSWVAIFGGQVVGVSEDYDALLASLREKGVPPERAFVERLTDEEELLILSFRGG